MHIPNAEIVSIDEARTLIAPVLARYLAGRDLQIMLDDELMFADAYDRSGVLLLPAGAVIDGDLRLDYETAEYEGKPYRGVLAVGALAVSGDILNGNVDGGPFLVVLGGLTARQILKGGATFIVAGPITSPGMIYCEYNHGAFRAFGGVAAQGIILDDQSHEIAAPISGIKLDLWKDDATQYLLPDFFYEDDEGSIEPIDELSELLKARILAGEPIFRDDAPGA
jgi:hypothetical protein